jgi:hypothetical protein
MRLGASLFLRAGAPVGRKLEIRSDGEKEGEKEGEGESLRRRETTRDGARGAAMKLRAGRDRDRNGRGRLWIFLIYARADTKTSKVSGG